MKKILLTCLTGLLLSLTITSGYSQSLKSIDKLSFPKDEAGYSEDEKAISYSPVAPDFVNTKALKAFTRTFKSIPDATWFEIGDGFVAKFSNDGIETRVYYSKKGHFAGMVRSYPEDKLPADVRHRVRSTYYDYSIFHINEVSANDKVAYLIKIQDNNSWKTIKVMDGEMEVAEEFQKR
jgi:hypothetical protein